MAYIGNTVQNQGFAPAVDYFNGDGTTVTFTLSRPVASVAQLTAVIDNVIQNPSSAFTVSGNAITFTSAPLSGTNNIWVEYTSLVTTYAAISQDPSVIGDLTASGGYLSTGDFGNSYIDGTIVDYVTGNARITTGPADGLTIYNGGTSARSALLTLNTSGALGVGTSPSYGTAGQALISGGSSAAPSWSTVDALPSQTGNAGKYLTTNGTVASWVNISIKASSVEYLIVAGGGGASSGGAGAGGMLTGTSAVAPGLAYTITIGGGGTGVGVSSNSGTNGSNSSFNSLTAIGGGRGAAIGDVGGSAGNGGSGGGGGAFSGGTTTGGSGTSGQGNAGGGNSGYTGGPYPSGGGGGAGATGQSATGPSTSGNGGVGLASSISGSSTYYAGGGGAGNYGGGTPGTGGTGGGGNGSGSANGAAGGGNTGGGGGGTYSSGTGGNGGSGIVIISYGDNYDAAIATGTYSYAVVSGNRVYTFTGSGTITF